ncbi:MAG: AmmeMemoRadiSam system protein A [Candidatus Izemoplasmatales bacterium]
MPLLAAYIVPHPPLIVPAVGRGEEAKIASTVAGYGDVASRIARLKPETIVLISPHSVNYADYIHVSPGAEAEGDLGQFGAKSVRFRVSYDETLASAIGAAASKEGIPAGPLGEKRRTLDHGTMVPLWFVDRAYPGCRLVRISLSGLSPLEHYRFGTCVRDAVEATGRNVVLIASGDLSHKLKEDGPYGFAPEGPVFDNAVTEAMASADFGRFLAFDDSLCDAAGECGLRSFLIMAGALDRKAVKGGLLSYEGPFGVGYAVAAYDVVGDDPARAFGDAFARSETLRLAAVKDGEDPYVRLARETLEAYVGKGRRIPRPNPLPAGLTDRAAGVFVTLKKDGRLRGCIGTTAPTTPCIADEIIQNAISAGTRDPRFDPVNEAELPSLVYGVDVLGPSEPIPGPEALDPKRYGVIVRKGGRSGLLLPDLEGVDTVADQVAIALRKGGIDPGERYALERFEVVRHH